MKSNKTTTTLNWILFALMLCFLASLAMPYFAYGENGESVSLLSYLAMPSDHREAEVWLGTQVTDYHINTLVNAHIPLFIAVIVGAILLVAFRQKPLFTAAVSTIVGVWGVIAYAANSILALGGGARTLHILLLSAIAVIGLASLIYQFAPHKEGEPERMTASEHAMSS